MSASKRRRVGIRRTARVAAGGLAFWAVTAASAENAERASDVAAWQAFCDRLSASGTEILETYPQQHGVDRAEALLYLAQQVGRSVEQQLVARDGAFPLLSINATTLDKWGMDGADVKYTGAALRGDGVYRVTGTLGRSRRGGLT